MSTHWCDMPKEILNIIFLHVKAEDKRKSKENLSQCSLVCHGWSTPAQTVLFSSIHIRNTNKIDSLTRSVAEKNELKYWVKVLTHAKDFVCTTTTLIAVDSLFPNLEILEFHGYDLSYSSFCKMLTLDGRFKNLRRIPIPANKEQDLMYNQCLEFLQEQIVSITLTGDEANSREMYQDVISKLNKFPRLRRVNIIRTTADMQYKNLAQYIITPVIENNSPPLLQESYITSITNPSYLLQLATLGQNCLLPMAELKHLNICINNEVICTVSEDLMLFIMNQCPNLKSLHLEKEGGKKIQCETISNYPSLFQFMIYLSKMPNFFLQDNIMFNKEATQLVEDFYTAIEEDSTSLKLSQSLSITASSRKRSSRNSFTSISFEKNYPTQIQSIDYKIFPKKDSEIGKEQVQVVENIGRFFNTLSLQIASSDDLVPLLESVASHCHRLNTLTIIDSFSVVSLLFDEQPVQYHDLANCNYNIKELILPNCCLSQEQLLFISNTLPGLKKLVLKNFLKHQSLLSEKYLFSFFLPNWTLDRLEIEMDKHFTVDWIEGLCYYIKLVTDVEQNPRYCFFRTGITDRMTTGYTLIDNPTEDGFQRSTFHDYVSTYYIYCRSVKEFCFNYIDVEDGYHKTFNMFEESIV